MCVGLSRPSAKTSRSVTSKQYRKAEVASLVRAFPDFVDIFVYDQWFVCGDEAAG